jgi:hypothetical protein
MGPLSGKHRQQRGIRKQGGIRKRGGIRRL